MILRLAFAALFSATPTFASNAPVAAPAATDFAIKWPVEKYKLENGLTVLLLEDHKLPMISYHTWYKVGSRDEREGITGSAHMLEHMMFKGAKKYTGKQLDHLLQKNGMDFNAFTSQDYTGFYMNLPSDKLDLVMDIELDRMSSLAIDPAALASEKEVVKEERRMRTDNNPMGLLYELMYKTVFHQSSYRWPVIGHMKDIEKFDAGTLREFYEKYYIASNAVLVIAGDFNSSDVKRKIEKMYGKLPYKTPPARVSAQELKQTVQYNAKIRKEVQGTTVQVVYQGLPGESPDNYALDLAANILTSGTASRLYKRLIYQKQIALNTSAWNSNLMDAGNFIVSVALKPGHQENEALDIVYNEIYQLRNKLVSPEELKKAKTMVLRQYIGGLQTLDSRAQALASMEITRGSYDLLFTELERYEAVTAENIRTVANRLFNQTQRSIVVLQPKEVTP